MKPIRLNHIKSIPLEFNLGTEHQPINVESDKVPKQTWKQCDLYNKQEPPRHCKDLKCQGHTLYYCYTIKKDE